MMTRFHLAFPVHDIDLTRQFYTKYDIKYAFYLLA